MNPQNERVKTSPVDLNDRARSVTFAARRAVDYGDYERARAELQEFWFRIGERPKIEGLHRYEAAEVLLCVGLLVGWIGSAGQIEGAQEEAKDLLNESATIFESLQHTAKAAEARSELAQCYWRQGAHDEARVILQSVLPHIPALNYELLGKTLLRCGIVERSARRYKDAETFLTQAVEPCEKTDNQLLLGSLRNELAVVLKNLWIGERRPEYIDRAFIEYAAAKFHWENAKHRRFCAVVENNMGALYYQVNDYTQAHQHLDQAKAIFLELNDSRSVAQVDETRAQVFLAQRGNKEAVKAAGASVRVLEKGGEQGLLVESIITYGTALARIGERAKAQTAFQRAAMLAYEVGSDQEAGRAWLVKLEELLDYLPNEQVDHAMQEATRLLEASQDISIVKRLSDCRLRISDHQLLGSGKKKRMERRVYPKSSFPEGFSLDKELLQYERMWVEKALGKAKTKAEAARLLGISRANLDFKLKSKRFADLNIPRKSGPENTVARDSVLSMSKLLLEICIPPGAKAEQGFIYIDVSTNEMETYGVRQGDLLVVQLGQVNEGDLAAIGLLGGHKKPRSQREVQAGHFYTGKDNRTIRLELSGEETQFNENSVEVLGKIIGYCKVNDIEACRVSYKSGKGCIPLTVHPIPA